MRGAAAVILALAAAAALAAVLATFGCESPQANVTYVTVTATDAAGHQVRRTIAVKILP